MLAHMLEGRELTAIDSVFACSTTRLASVVHELGKRHGWRIERRDQPVDTTDGRTATVTAYSLSADVREAAFASGARAWVDEVKVARATRRNGG
ncbi:helix-turn-helix domain-containing protein [Paraburkholderia sacchari]